MQKSKEIALLMKMRLTGNSCAQKSKEIAFIMKMRSTMKIPKCITRGILANICSNSFSNCKVDQKKTVAFSQMFNRVQLHAHYIH